MSVEMSDEEIAEFLRSNLTATVVSINPSGMPLPTPVWFTNRERDVFFSTMRKTQKAKNLERDERCVVQVEAGTRYTELRAVIITGRAQEATAEENDAFQAERVAKYQLSPETAEKMPDATRKHYDNPRIVFRVVPDRVRSWDNRKLRMKD